MPFGRARRLSSVFSFGFLGCLDDEHAHGPDGFTPFTSMCISAISLSFHILLLLYISSHNLIHYPFCLVIWSHSSSHTIWFLDGLSPCPSPSPLGHSPPHYITRTRIHFTPTGLPGHIIMNMIYHPNAYLISHTLPPRSHTLFAFHQFIASSIQISHASIPLP